MTVEAIIINDIFQSLTHS